MGLEGLNINPQNNIEKKDNFEDIKELLNKYPYSYSQSQLIEEYSNYNPEKIKVLRSRFNEYNEFKLKELESKEELKKLDEKYLVNKESQKKIEKNKDVFGEIKSSFNEEYLLELIKRFDENFRKGKNTAYWIEVGANKMTNNYYNNIGKKIPNNTKSDDKYQKIKNDLKEYYYNNFINKERPKNFYEKEENE